MNFSLNTTIIKPISEKHPTNAVILLHGYGGDGKDISTLSYTGKDFYQIQFLSVLMHLKYVL